MFLDSKHQRECKNRMSRAIFEYWKNCENVKRGAIRMVLITFDLNKEIRYTGRIYR